MAHKVMINGTAYGVAGGTGLGNGTKYQMGGGKTLIAGTGYEIKFSNPVQVQVTTENPYANNWGGVYINGTRVSEGLFELEKGDIVVLACGGNRSNTTITIDGTVVVKHSYSTTGGVTRYNYTLEKDCRIKTVRYSTSNSVGTNIIVTTERPVE